MHIIARGTGQHFNENLRAGWFLICGRRYIVPILDIFDHLLEIVGLTSKVCKTGWQAVRGYVVFRGHGLSLNGQLALGADLSLI